MAFDSFLSFLNNNNNNNNDEDGFCQWNKSLNVETVQVREGFRVNFVFVVVVFVVVICSCCFIFK